jgi:beta-glucosidase
VELTVGPNERRYWNAAVRDHVVEASTFDLWVGGDSRADLAATFTTTKG